VERRAPARAERGAELRQVLVERDDALPLHVAAPLRPHLVLEEAAGGAQADQLADRPLDVERVAVTRVDVDHDGDVDRGADPTGGVEHLALREEAEVRACETGRRERVARDEHGAEAGTDREERAQRVVDAR
jgi:hypothetical protein